MAITKRYLVLIILILIVACSKKHQPQTGVVPVSKPKPIPHRPLPATLDVPDKVAMKDIDGRLYYDIEGHRYWKNYVDGKYYKYNKAMYDDPAFKPR